MAQSTTYNLDVYAYPSGYQPRNPKASAYYKCVENHFEELERAYPEGQKLEYGEWLLTHVLKDVPHRHWVFSIPKRLRIDFLYDRELLAKLSICAWKVMNAYLRSAALDSNAAPGAGIAVRTYGDFLNFNPHLHAIVTDGCFPDDGSFKTAPGFMLKDLEKIFQYEVLKMLKKVGKINDTVIENILSWRHSGFHVYIGDGITPPGKTGLGNLARYIIRACFSPERMVYVPAGGSTDGLAKVVYV